MLVKIYVKYFLYFELLLLLSLRAKSKNKEVILHIYFLVVMVVSKKFSPVNFRGGVFFFIFNNSNAIELLKENENKINWYGMYTNPKAIELLKANDNKID